jgi:hypothetical protein
VTDVIASLLGEYLAGHSGPVEQATPGGRERAKTETACSRLSNAASLPCRQATDHKRLHAPLSRPGAGIGGAGGIDRVVTTRFRKGAKV